MKNRGFWAILPAMILCLFAAQAARAGTVTCPSHMVLSGVVLQDPWGSPAVATSDVNNKLLCVYPGIGFSESTAAPANGPCAAKTVTIVLSNGTGTWYFGPPGSASTLPLPVTNSGGRCHYGGVDYNFPFLAVWQKAPNGQTCVQSTGNKAAFTCTTSPVTTAGLCPASLAGSALPATNWSAASSRPGYYPPDSAIIDVANGQVVAGSASYSAVKSSMGSGFAGATFNLVGGIGTASNLPSNVITCSYDGPRYRKSGKTLEATVTTACQTTCAGL
jgi:hypothetical protein